MNSVAIDTTVSAGPSNLASRTHPFQHASAMPV
jgi:hypothetical protein